MITVPRENGSTRASSSIPVVGSLPFTGSSHIEGRVNISFSTAVLSMSSYSQDGGDFAETFALPDGSVAIGAWDASGHGRDAVANMTLIRAGLRALLYKNADLVSAMHALNRVLYRQANDTMPWPFVTGFFAIVASDGCSLRYVSCGHETAILFAAEARYSHLSCTGPLLGVSDSWEFQDKTIRITAGDTLAVVTDGITNARPLASRFDYFGSKRLRSIFQPPDNRVNVKASAVIAQAVAHSDGYIEDDAAALIVNCTGSVD